MIYCPLAVELSYLPKYFMSSILDYFRHQSVCPAQQTLAICVDKRKKTDKSKAFFQYLKKRNPYLLKQSLWNIPMYRYKVSVILKTNYQHKTLKNF